MSRRITRLNPKRLHDTPGYHHVTVVEAGRTAYLAGRCPLDRTLLGVAQLGFRGQLVELDLIAALDR